MGIVPYSGVLQQTLRLKSVPKYATIRHCLRVSGFFQITFLLDFMNPRAQRAVITYFPSFTDFFACLRLRRQHLSLIFPLCTCRYAHVGATFIFIPFSFSLLLFISDATVIGAFLLKK